ncbi:unnamed protein product [Schistosoma margrebowiei]|uniref:C2 domain-containing protein n=1 Tax=Schistosoma margrebowiei TaxID=48269 RepID=A0AA85AIF7_9TREM|nr:unnamed protein product [Schistosoma margrebowiei]
MENKNSISSWSKEKLEDQYLRLYDDYLTLKKHACKQEDRIKKMATKILRLANDKKDSDPGTVWKEDYQEQIEVLERKNATLTRKLALVQNQLNVQKQRIGSAPLSARKASSATIQTTSRNSLVGEKSMNNSNVIQTLRFQNSAFEKTIQKLSEQLKERDELINQFKQELQMKEKIHTNDLFILGEQVTSKQRIALQENLDLIRTQRELREKQLIINNLESRIKESESNQNILKSTNHQLINEIERLTRESSQLEQKLFHLQSDNNLASKQQLKILELQYAFDDAKRENQALKESNEKLIANAFSIKPEQNWIMKEQKLRGQIDHLEMMVHNLQQQLNQTEQQQQQRPQQQQQQQRKQSIEEQIILNKQQSNQLESIPMKQNNSNEQLTVNKTTTQMFAQITGFTVEELEEAIMILRERKSKSQSVTDDLSPNLLDQNKDSLKQLNETELLHVDTINELEKTRKLLNIQYKINKDYQIEIKQLTNRYNELKLESEQCLIEYKKLLEIRLNRIKQLENQLHNLTYGILNKYKNDQLSNDKLTTEDALKPGESLIELHIGQLYLLPSLLSKYYSTISSNINNDKNDELIQLFLTWDFYDYETQSTSILLVHDSIDFNMTIQYPIEVNDTLMNYLIKEPCTVEMHQVINSNYRTIAIGKLNFSQLFTEKDDIIELPGSGSVIRRHGQLDLFLISTPDNSMNSKEMNKVNEKIKVGTLDYWIRLSAPMPDSIKLYKERFQQLPKSMSSTQQDLLPIDPLQNILTIEIVKITNLARNYLDYLPSIYFVYQFYNQPEYASTIMKENLTPIFNDCRTIQLEMNDKLDNYLRTENLNIYIVDNADPSPETSCIGLARIPLIGLINKNQKIDGVFEIFPLNAFTNKQQQQQQFNRLEKFNQIDKNLPHCGLLYLKIYWQQPYTTNNNTTNTTTTNSLKTVVYNQPNMEESKDLEMEPVRQAAEKPYITQYESSKETYLQSKSLSDVSFTKPNDKLHSSDNLSHSSDKQKQDKTDLDQAIVKIPEITVNKPDNQVSIHSTDHSKINTRTDKILSPSIQIELENSEEKLIVPTPHPRTKITESQDEKKLINLDVSSQKTINNNNVSNSKLSPTVQSISTDNDNNHVKIELHGLQLTNLSKLSKINQSLPNQLFIEYSFLGYKEPFETGSYPLIEWIDNNKNILKANFYYSKTFPVDFTKNYERRQYLASYLLPEDPNNGNLIFIIVSEPSTSTTQSAECEEIGYAMINIRQIIRDNCNIDHVFIPITAAKTVDGETESLNEIGRLCVSFYGLSALRAIIAEMPQVKLAI